MIATAKVFTTGNSQAIRLPKAFRMAASEVWITKIGDSGHLGIQPKPTADELALFLAQLKSMPVTDEFVPARDDTPRPSPFEDWAA